MDFYLSLKQLVPRWKKIILMFFSFPYYVYAIFPSLFLCHRDTGSHVLRQWPHTLQELESPHHSQEGEQPWRLTWHTFDVVWARSKSLLYILRLGAGIIAPNNHHQKSLFSWSIEAHEYADRKGSPESRGALMQEVGDTIAGAISLSRQSRAQANSLP